MSRDEQPSDQLTAPWMTAKTGASPCYQGGGLSVTIVIHNVATGVDNLMNKLTSKKLLQSKWTKVTPQAREKHFIVIEVDYDEQQNVQHCVIEAVHSGRQYAIDWRSLKDSDTWLVGWH